MCDIDGASSATLRQLYRYQHKHSMGIGFGGLGTNASSHSKIFIVSSGSSRVNSYGCIGRGGVVRGVEAPREFEAIAWMVKIGQEWWWM